MLSTGLFCLQTAQRMFAVTTVLSQSAWKTNKSFTQLFMKCPWASRDLFETDCMYKHLYSKQDYQ